MSGIYLHIPFCKQACHYCDFHFSTSLKKKSEMIDAIIRELQLRKNENKDTIETIYFGGGTPSVLEIGELKAILETIYKNYKVIDNPEITLEANPDDLISVKERSGTIFKDYRTIGINRLSIGIQSFFEEDLLLMNRAHNAKEAESCLIEATRYFDNISIDLIYGMPNMSNEKWISNIEKALSFNIPHISSYALTVEPKTALADFIKKGKIKPIDDEIASAHFSILVDKLTKADYICYEVSNFGKPDFFSKHNTSYWQGKRYLGIGPSAHSFDGQRRGWNIRNNAKYIKSIMEGVLPIEVEKLSIADQYNEYVMTGLRTIWGVSLPKIELDFGKEYRQYLVKEAQRHIVGQLLYIDNDTLLVTKKGKFLTDGIASDLFYVKLERKRN
ncbi:oxygen-independent coproporphyrinogen-3 oxidase [Saonia flava]|uniref:Heme chaperone HemW n=1 Tax=Saonia flava TaxID=523696 RepID=A0A846QSM3_9FLAO|nr:radical SAM family heme chaperone HemW [Saonia flava]NJB71058.1 oxygen-independent coproporphyrinogen-3 oxidase [Saonia flava]